MDVYEALYTTRAMRRVRPDPIPYPVQARILDAAIRAPNGGNAQGWRFILVDDPAVKAELGPLYRDSIDRLWATVYRDALERARSAPVSRAPASPCGWWPRRSTWPITSRRCRCSCWRSPGATPRAAPSSPPCGAPSWPPERRAWAAR